jgi:hypothetical protein
MSLASKFLSQFETGRLTSTGWKDLIIDARTYVDDSEDKDMKDDEEEDEEMGDEGSIPSGFNKGKYDKVEEFEFKWEGNLHQLGGDADWAPTVRAHQAAIDLLGHVLNTSSQCHLAEIKALDKQGNRGIQEATEMQVQLQWLHKLVQDHHSLANAVNAALETGHASLEALEKLKEEMDSFATSLKEFSVEAKVTSELILKMIGLLRSRAQARNDDVRACLAQLESIVNGIDCPASPPTVQQRFFQSSLGGDTPLGTAFIGGTETTLTANMLFNLIQELQAKVDLLAERAKNTGVIFNDLCGWLSITHLEWPLQQWWILILSGHLRTPNYKIHRPGSMTWRSPGR